MFIISLKLLPFYIRSKEHKQPSLIVMAHYKPLDYIFKPVMDRCNGSELQKSWSQPRNQPVKVGGSKPCFTVTMGVLLSLVAGSDSIYLTAKVRRDKDEDELLANENSSNVAENVFFPYLKSKFHFFHLH